MDKYSELWEYFADKNAAEIKLSFEELQNIVWIEIDHSFLTYKKNLEEYWYKVEKFSQKERFVIFKKLKQRCIVLTSCGIRNEEFKDKFYRIISRENLKNAKILYITTASDGDNCEDKSWMEEEFETMLELGIDRNNIVEYKIGNSHIDINSFDIMYMMGGNTFYLLDVIRKTFFDKDIKAFIDSGKIYIGSSAGSEILGSSIDTAIGYDENNVNMKDFTWLKIVDGLIIPHCNRKKEFIKNLKNKTEQKLYLLYDGDGIII